MGDFYQLQFHRYERSFRQPLHTSQGIWKVRAGIIIEMTDSLGNLSRGEIAPLPRFGSETLSAALEFCHSLSGNVSQQDILAIPDSLPACQFAFESALLGLTELPQPKERLWNYSYLLPTGVAALTAWQKLLPKLELTDTRSILTFKWKIGVDSISSEIAIFKRLMSALPSHARLRLDANSGLTLAKARQWMETTAKFDRVEFLEQPLPPSQLDLMFALQDEYPTQIALDESVANCNDLERCYRWGWRGIFVLKPAIAGFPSRLLHFCQEHNLDVVFSSVFETEIGRQAVFRLARELISKQHLVRERPLGYGVDLWF
jgi:O-succinylbenzoate synthase